MKRILATVIMAVGLFLAAGVHATTITVDGDISDWSDVPVLATDSGGDFVDSACGFNSNHRDLLSIKTTSDAQNLYYLVQYGQFCGPYNGLYLTFDTDLDSSTGCHAYGGGVDMFLSLTPDATVLSDNFCGSVTTFTVNLTGNTAWNTSDPNTTYIEGSIPLSYFPQSSVVLQSVPDLLSAPVVVALTPPSAKLTGFVGGNLSLQVFSPTQSQPASSPYAIAVGPGAQFTNLPAHQLAGYLLANVNINVSNDTLQLDFSPAGSATYGTGAFNGYVFTTSGGIPPITGVTVDPSTTLGLDSSRVFSNANQIFVNVQGLSFNPQTTAKVNVAFGNTQVQPPDPIRPQGTMPLGSGAKKLALVIHGWNSSASAPWVSEMVQKICARLGGPYTVPFTTVTSAERTQTQTCSTPDWDVQSLDWHQASSQQLMPFTSCALLATPGLCPNGNSNSGSSVITLATPWDAYAQAFTIGDWLAQRIEANGYEYVHLIAHSAGSNVAQQAIDVIHNDKVAGICSGTSASGVCTYPKDIHVTFLDAFDKDGKASRYGQYATWAEQYVDKRPLLYDYFKVADTTATDLEQSFNFNVTTIDPRIVIPVPKSLAYHAWPYDYYTCTILPGVTSDGINCTTLSELDYGFNISLEAGANFWANAIANPVGKKGGNPHKCDAPFKDNCPAWNADPTRVQFTQLSPTLGGDVTTSPTGVIQTEPSSLDGTLMQNLLAQLQSGSPAWIVVPFVTQDPIDNIQLDYQFSTQGEGQLVVYIDGELTFMADERFAGTQLRRTSRLPTGGLAPGVHKLGFRLDPFANQQSIVQVSNIQAFRTDVAVVPIQAPIANAGVSRTVEATSPAGASVVLDGSGSSDPGGDTLRFTWTGAFPTVSGIRPTVTLPLGTNLVTLTVSNGLADTSTTVTITVVDTIPPIVAYTGNVGIYIVDQTVNITCAATDSGSGVASTTCQNVSRPAYAFSLGTNTFSAIATDMAGNVGSGSTTFTVKVTTPSLVTLTKRFITKPLVQLSLVGELKLAAEADERGRLEAKAKFIALYIAELKAVTGKAITAENAAILIKLAQAL